MKTVQVLSNRLVALKGELNMRFSMFRVFGIAVKLTTTLLGMMVMIPIASADNTCKRGKLSGEWYGFVHQGRNYDKYSFTAFHPDLPGSCGRKTAALWNGRRDDNSYGKFLQGYNAKTDRIWIDYRKPEESSHTQCGFTASKYQTPTSCWVWQAQPNLHYV